MQNHQEEDHDGRLEAKEDEGRSHRRQRQDLPGEGNLLDDPGVVDDDPRTRQDTQLANVMAGRDHGRDQAQ